MSPGPKIGLLFYEFQRGRLAPMKFKKIDSMFAPTYPQVT